MSDFLTLCQDLHREVGGAGSAPAAVTGQVGQSLRTVNWIKNAYIKIQNKHANWRWMTREFVMGSSPSLIGYTELTYLAADDFLTGASIARFSRWWPVIDGRNDFKVYTAASGIGTQTFMSYLPWSEFSQVWRMGTNQSMTSASPQYVSVTPQNSLAFAPIASEETLIRGYYQQSPQILAADTDEPEMPERFHELIVWEAMKRYARFVAAPEVYADARVEAGQMMRDLEVDQLPPPCFAPPLA
jgi:hypothetical protein